MFMNKKFIGNSRFGVFFLLIFFKNLLIEYLFQKEGVGEWSVQKSGLFLTAFNVVDWAVFWYIFRATLENKLQIVFLFLLTIVSTSLPYFLSKPLIKLDYDNLIVHAAASFIPFLVYIFFKKTPKLFFLPILMGFVPLVNLEIANEFTGNLSFLYPFFRSGILDQSFGNEIFIDLGLVLVKTMFWAALVILFYEIDHQFFVLKSWRFDVELPIRKGSLVIVFLIFKTLIYWLIGSILIVLVGNNSVQLFTNKIGLGLSGIGLFGFLCILSIYFRKYLTLFFYEKVGHSNWLYTLFFIPFLDILALLITVTVPFAISKKYINFKFSRENLVWAMIISLMGYAVTCYFMFIKDIPASEKELKMGLIIAQIVFPILSIIGLYLALKSNLTYRILLLILVLALPLFSFYLVPKIELSGKINLLVNTVSVYLQTGLFIFFVYPILYFKEYLKLK